MLNALSVNATTSTGLLLVQTTVYVGMLHGSHVQNCHAIISGRQQRMCADLSPCASLLTVRMHAMHQ